MSVSDHFWDASLDELKQGFWEEDHHFACLLCGKKVEKGIVYPEDGMLYEAARYMRVHIEKEHGSVFEYLSQLDKRLTGLSDHQNSLMRLFYKGKSDADVQKELGIGSSSTIRNHRFALKEKERQSKVFLVMMELMRESDKKRPNAQPAAKSEAVRDEPSAVTSEEYEQILRKCFPEGPGGSLHKFPRKHKHRLVVLQEIAKRFDPNKYYTEKEVNQILEAVYEDHVTLRRYLIDYQFLDREADGSQYWAKEQTKEGEQLVNRKQELKQMYKEMKTEAGVYQIKNVKNQKVFIGSTKNLKTLNGKKFSLQHGGFINRELQQEWNEMGEDAFVIEVLEVVEQKPDPFFDLPGALEKMEEKWLEKLQPYGERGYNRKKPD